MSRPKSEASTRSSRAKADILAATGTEKRAFSIPEFCVRHSISIGTYESMRRAGHGPREIRIGRRVLITIAAEAEWEKTTNAAGQIDLTAA